MEEFYSKLSRCWAIFMDNWDMLSWTAHVMT